LIEAAQIDAILATTWKIEGPGEFFRAEGSPDVPLSSLPRQGRKHDSAAEISQAASDGRRDQWITRSAAAAL
jgi:hypothetical protein